VGHPGGGDHRGASEGADPGHARHIGARRAQRPAGDAAHLRVSAVQDQDAGPHLRVDPQPQDPGEARQVGAGRRGPAAQRMTPPVQWGGGARGGCPKCALLAREKERAGLPGLLRTKGQISVSVTWVQQRKARVNIVLSNYLSKKLFIFILFYLLLYSI